MVVLEIVVVVLAGNQPLLRTVVVVLVPGIHRHKAPVAAAEAEDLLRCNSSAPPLCGVALLFVAFLLKQDHKN